MSATGALRHGNASPPEVSTLLERDAELARLQRLLAAAAAGEGRVLFVEGEAGIGKTALLDALELDDRVLEVGSATIRQSSSLSVIRCGRPRRRSLGAGKSEQAAQ